MSLRETMASVTWRSVLSAALLILLPLFAFRGALGGAYIFDDYSLLALPRFFDNPLLPFVQEHVDGGLHYRPMGLLFWWLSERLFGLSPLPHYLLNIGLLVAVAFALRRFLRTAVGKPEVAFAIALLFVVHPVMIGTAAWLSNRYELLAALFGLLALSSAWRFRGTHSPAALIRCLILFGCGLLAKENTLALIAAAMVFWAWPTSVPTRPLLRRLLPCLWLMGLVAAWLLVRALVLPSSGEDALFNYKSPLDLFRDGMTAWFSKLPAFVVLGPRLGWATAAIYATGAVGLVVVVLRAMRSGWDADRVALIVGGFALILVAAFVQWPRTGLVLQHLNFGAAAFDDVLAGRYYFMAALGFAIVLAGLLSPPQALPVDGTRRVAVVSTFLILIALFSVSQHLARSYRGATLVQNVYAQAAVAAIDRLDLPVAGCQIYLLDTHNPLFGFYSDLSVKALSQDLARVSSCFVQTETASWYNLVDADQVARAQDAPFTPVRAGAGVLEPVVLGRGALVYLNLAPLAAPPTAAGVFYLAWVDDHFIDVSDDVRAGRRKVQFGCFRPPSQCP